MQVMDIDRSRDAAILDPLTPEGHIESAWLSEASADASALHGKTRDLELRRC